jgi:hypothetical protein
VPQSCYFSIQNALKLTYKHLQVKQIFRGLRPRTPQNTGKGRGREGKKEGRGKGKRARGWKGEGGREGGREGKVPREGGKGKNWGYSPPKFLTLSTPLPATLRASDVSVGRFIDEN